MSESLRKKYRHIVAWGSMMGSYAYYVNDQVARAEADGAPENAVFYSTDEDRWKTYDEVKSLSTRERIDAILEKQGQVNA